MRDTAAPVPRIELRDVHKAFGPKRVLAGVSLKVMPGESLVVIGGSLERLQGRFVEVARAGEADHPLAIPGERHLPIWIVHRTRQGNLESLWPALKNWR